MIRIKVGQLWQSGCGNLWRIESVVDSYHGPCWAWVRRIEPKQDRNQYYWHWLAFQPMKLVFSPEEK